MTARIRGTLRRVVQQVVLTLSVIVCLTHVVSAQQSSETSAGQQRAVPAPGVDSTLDARVKDVSSHLRCPVCQGESIQDSPAELAAQMKTLVREQLAAGRNEQQVLDYFVEKYGQWILLAPKAEGFNLLVYWLPIVFLSVGVGIIWIAVKRWTRPATALSTVNADVVRPGTDGTSATP